MPTAPMHRVEDVDLRPPPPNFKMVPGSMHATVTTSAVESEWRLDSESVEVGSFG